MLPVPKPRLIASTHSRGLPDIGPVVVAKGAPDVPVGHD